MGIPPHNHTNSRFRPIQNMFGNSETLPTGSLTLYLSPGFCSQIQDFFLKLCLLFLHSQLDHSETSKIMITEQDLLPFSLFLAIGSAGGKSGKQIHTV